MFNIGDEISICFCEYEEYEYYEHCTVYVIREVCNEDGDRCYGVIDKDFIYYGNDEEDEKPFCSVISENMLVDYIEVEPFLYMGKESYDLYRYRQAMIEEYGNEYIY